MFIQDEGYKDVYFIGDWIRWSGITQHLLMRLFFSRISTTTTTTQNFKAFIIMEYL